MPANVVLIPDAQFKGPPDVESGVLGPSARIEIYRERDPSAVAEPVWRDCEILLVWHEMPIGKAALEHMQRCRLVVRVGAGFDTIDLQACGERGIAVCNVPDYGVEEVADHALALALALARGIVRYHNAVAANPVSGWAVPASQAIRRLRGLYFGVVGLGRIGTAVARRAAAFGLTVGFYDPYLPDGVEIALGFDRAADLEALLSRCDILSLHAPLTTETRGLIGADAFARLKPDAVLVNTARGGLVDLDALHAALAQGKLQAAALDVLPEEPPDPDHPLLAALAAQAPWVQGRLIVTPHAAWYSRDSYVSVREKAARTALAFLRGEPLRNCVNREYLRGGPLLAPPTSR